MPATSVTISSGSDPVIYLHDLGHSVSGRRSVHSPASTESQSGHSSAGSWSHVGPADYDNDIIEPSDSASRSRHSSARRTHPEAPQPPTRRHSSRSVVIDAEDARHHSSHRSRPSRHVRGESRRTPSDEASSIVAGEDDYPYHHGMPHQQRPHYRAAVSHGGYPPSVNGAPPYPDAFQAQALVHMPTDAFGYPVSNPFASGQPNPFAPMPPASQASGYYSSDAGHAPRPQPVQRMSMYAASPPGYPDMYAHQGLTMYPPPMPYMYPPHQPPSNPASPPPTEDKSAKEFESLKELIKKHEEERFAWEKAIIAKAEAEAAAKAAAAAKAEEEKKKKEEIASASAKAKETAEKKAEEDAKKAKEEAEKKLAEAQKAKEEAEKKTKELEEEKKKNAPAPDASKEPIKFKDAANRKFSFPWAVCKSWKGMENLIRQAFAHIEVLGPHVLEGHYYLTGPDGEIILPQVWETTVQPGWEILMTMWPIAELEPPLPKTVAPPKDMFSDLAIDELLQGMNLGAKPAKAPKAGKSTSKKSKGKDKVINVPIPPMHDDLDFASLLPPGMVLEDKRKPKASSSSKGKAKEIPAMMRWMYGGPPAKKDDEKLEIVRRKSTSSSDRKHHQHQQQAQADCVLM